MSLLFAISMALTAQNFEYALSQEGFVGSAINDLEIVGDKIIIAGGAGSCMLPAWWLFDTSGRFLDFRLLEIPYGYGYVTTIHYDSLAGHLLLLAYTQVADDVAGSSIYAWTLDTQFNIISSKDLFGEPVSVYHQPRFSHQFITAVEGEDLVIFDRQYSEVNRVDIMTASISIRDAFLLDSNIIAFDYDTGEEALIHHFSWDGTLIQSGKFLPSQEVFPAGHDRIYSLGKDSIIRKYSFPELSLADSITLPPAAGYEMKKISERLFEVIVYRHDSTASVMIFDTALQYQDEISSGLKNENKIQGKLKGRTYYNSGDYYGYLPGSFLNSPPFVPFLRKTDLADRSFRRQTLTIHHVSLKNEVTPVDTGRTMDGRPWQFYSGDDPLVYEITFENNSDSVVHNFCYYSDIQFSFNCVRYNGYQFIDSVIINPGQQLVVSDTVYPYFILADRGLNFYVAAPNHLLSDSSTYAYRVDDLTTAQRDSRQPTALELFPNPATDRIYLQWEASGRNRYYQIVDLKGTLIREGELTENLIQLSHLPPGFYLMKIFEGQEVRVSRFIKQ
jgi:hypothetical protein